MRQWLDSILVGVADHCGRLSFQIVVLLGRVAQLISGLHAGIFLGLLDRKQLHALCQRFYAREEKYRDPQHAKSGLFTWETAAVDRFFPQEGRVLVLAAGNGREVLALERRGYDIDAFECDGELARLGNQILKDLGGHTAISTCAVDICPPNDSGIYDAAVVGWGAYSHILGRQARLALLTELRRQLVDGGVLLVSFLAAQRGTGLWPWRWVAVLANAIRWARRRRRSIEAGDHLRPTCVHYFTLPEAQEELSAAGFEVVACSEAGYAHAVARNVPTG